MPASIHAASMRITCTAFKSLSAQHHTANCIPRHYTSRPVSHTSNLTSCPLLLQDCFALGAIFAATDSVAVLQVLDQGRMPLLFSLAFGEGVINDATSVVLLGAVNKIFPGDDHTSRLSWGVAAGILGQFAYLFITSFALGAASGLGIAFLLKRFQGGWQGPHQEVAIIGLLAYLSYLLAEVLGLSGILSLFCCGIAVSQYALFSVSPAGRITVDNVFRTLRCGGQGQMPRAAAAMGMMHADHVVGCHSLPWQQHWHLCAACNDSILTAARHRAARWSAAVMVRPAPPYSA